MKVLLGEKESPPIQVWRINSMMVDRPALATRARGVTTTTTFKYAA